MTSALRFVASTLIERSHRVHRARSSDGDFDGWDELEEIDGDDRREELSPHDDMEEDVA